MFDLLYFGFCLHSLLFSSRLDLMSLQSLNTKRFTEIAATCFIFMQTEDRKGNWAKHPGPSLPFLLSTS